MMHDPMAVEIYIETFVDGSAADVGVPLIATLSRSIIGKVDAKKPNTQFRC